MIAEDDPVARATACNMFRRFGLAVFDADTGEAALHILSAHPEIVLLFADIRMPGMSGQELAREAHRMRPDLKIVLTSGWMGDSPIKDVPFVAKPFRLDDLDAILARTLNDLEKSHD